MNKIKISVLMPTYNRAQFIAEALDSVIPQLTEDDEIIIMDDGSTDNTFQIVKPFLKDNRIQYFKKEHTNAPDSRNQAIRLAKHPWILWFDSDDILLPNVIKTHKKFLHQYPEVDVFYGNLKVVGKTENYFRLMRGDYYEANSRLIFDFLHGNQIPNPGIFVRKSIYFDYGMYDVSFNRLHDYEYWVRTASRVRFKHIERFTCKWRWHDTNMSSGSVFRDLSYDSRVLDELVSIYKLEEIFPMYKWKNTKKKNFFLSKVFLEIASSYSAVHNYKTSDGYLLKSLQANKEINIAYPLMINFMKSERKDINLKIKHYLDVAIKKIMQNKSLSFEKHYNISSFYKKVKDYKNSSKCFLNLIQKIKTRKKYQSLFGKACFHMGEICLILDKKEDALRYFSDCCKAYPEHQKAIEYLKQLT